ncbi:hypothetical protein [Persicobacter diffluens]|uniref:Uncharacterized protein n=1 Tax=Persicobacter diffluens TaxID=981 RepID=A0AAN5AME8_9BACT|nr:hypothetical protein PEDI_42990 [Persicobacter diffluens]
MEKLAIGTIFKLNGRSLKVEQISQQQYGDDPNLYEVYLTDKAIYRNRNIISTHRVNTWIAEGRIEIVANK